MTATAEWSRVGRVVAERRILAILVRRDLRVRYARSVLGYVWTILDPLAMSLIYFLVFAIIFKRSDVGHKPYFLFLIVGLLSWQWFNASITESARALLTEAKLIRSTNLARELWVARVVIAKGVEYLLTLPVLAVITAVYVLAGQASVNVHILLMPLGVLLEFVLLIGIGLILAPVTVMVDDALRLVRIVLRMMFYLTPIIYTIKWAPDWLEKVLWFNPLSGIFELLRAGFFSEPIQWPPVFVGAAVAVVLLLLGLRVFARMERRVLKEI